MSETNTRAGLRASALEQARTLASNEFGVVVLKQVDVAGNAIAEQTRTVSAGLVRLTVAGEVVRTAPDGQVLIDYQVKAVIDGEELQRQVKALWQNTSRDHALKGAIRENEALRKQLQAQEATGGERVVRVLEGQVFNALTANRVAGAPAVVELPEGALLRAANHNPGKQQRVSRIEAEFFGPLMAAKLQFRLERPLLIPKGLRVPFVVEWKVDVPPLSNTAIYLGLYPRAGPGNDYYGGLCLTGGREELKDEPILLELSVAERKAYFMLAGEHAGQGYCLSTGKFRDRRGSIDLSEDEAWSARSITTRVVRASAVPVEAARSAKWF